MNLYDLPSVSIVVIGHNESKTLKTCFEAINKMNYPREKLEVIFVDSKSSDNSLEIAKLYADKVFSEGSNWPTAGEAFNRGIFESSHDIIHITGGDIALDSEYLLQAVKKLQERNDIKAVTGYFIEKNNLGWNKILGYRREEDNPKQEHFVQTPNGGTFRKHSILAINGYDERIKKGQESELGERFNKAGFKILHLNMEQGVHDFGLDSFHDVLKRYFWNGYYTTHLIFLSFHDKKNQFLKHHSSKKIKQLFIHSFLLILFLSSIVFNSIHFGLLFVISYLSILYFSVFRNSKKFTANYKKYRLLSFLFGSISYWGSLYFIVMFYVYKLKGNNLVRPFQGLKINKKDSLI